METLAGKPSPETFEYLSKRRSVKAADLLEPGPSAAQIEALLTAAARVPDHGKTVPFYFTVFSGKARIQAGQVIEERFKVLNPDVDEEKITKERERFLRAPLVVGVVMRMRKAKHPVWEQIMTCGAVCQNLILAANASGFGAQWLSEWYAYDEEVRSALGMDERDVLAGFIHIGTSPEASPDERPRADLSQITTYWSPDVTINKGDCHDNEKFEFPRAGFTLPYSKG